MKATEHTRITEEAVRRFVHHSASPVAPMLLQHSRLVQRGAEDADISPIYTRITNWHFYNRNLDCDLVHEPIWSFMEPLTFHLSSDRILQKRCIQLQEEVAKRSITDSCNLIGRILHHIQDMSTPSHVVPVYHGPLVPDAFETYLHKHYLHGNGQLAAVAVAPPAGTTLDPLPGTTVLQLYQEAAEETLHLLQPEQSSCAATVNGRAVHLPWSYFWADKNTSHQGSYPTECTFGGFGSFGPLGKHFGVTAEITSGDDTFLVAQQVYDDFCRLLVKKMLTDSVRCLMLLEPELRKLC